MKLPIYDLKINENLQDEAEVNYIALVDEPAIQRDFLAFKDEKERMCFKIINEEQRIISGPLMLADELIYRNNDKMGEHYVKFSADTIKAISIKFAKKKYQNHVNLMHDPEQKVKGVTMFESWLVDSKRGIQAMKGFEGVADGSWFGSFYVENDKVWQDVKDGKFRGFSVEGMFDYEQPLTAEENALKKISELLNVIIHD